MKFSTAPADNLGRPIELNAPAQDVSLFHVLTGFVDHIRPLVSSRCQLVKYDGGDEPEPSLAQHVCAQIVRQNFGRPLL